MTVMGVVRGTGLLVLLMQTLLLTHLLPLTQLLTKLFHLKTPSHHRRVLLAEHQDVAPVDRQLVLGQDLELLLDVLLEVVGLLGVPLEVGPLALGQDLELLLGVLLAVVGLLGVPLEVGLDRDSVRTLINNNNNGQLYGGGPRSVPLNKM
jgi:hypothetical protein